MTHVFYDDCLLPSSWQAKAVAVATVSQLLEAKEDVFQSAAAATDYDDTFAT